MKNSIYRQVVLISTACLFLLSACGMYEDFNAAAPFDGMELNSGRETEISISIEEFPLELENLNNNSAPESAGKSSMSRALPGSITNVTVTITGSHFSYPIIYDLVKINNVWRGIIGDIPAGAVTVLAQAYDGANVLKYATSANITVVKDQTLTLNMVLIPVNPPDDYNVKAPLVTGINVSPQKVAPGKTVQLQAFASDPDSQALTYVWTPQNIGSFNNANSQAPVWTAPQSQAVYQLLVTVIDTENLIDMAAVTIDVNQNYGVGNIAITTDSNEYPVINDINAAPTRIDRNKTTQISVSATDPEGRALSYAWSSACGGSFSSAAIANPVYTSASNVDYGQCGLTVNVSDGSLITVAKIFINISNDPVINAAPDIKSKFQSATSVNSGGNVVFIVRAQDPEGSPITFTWSATGGATGTPETTYLNPDYQGKMTWTAPQSSVDPITVTVQITDNKGLSRTLTFIPVTVITK